MLTPDVRILDESAAEGVERNRSPTVTPEILGAGRMLFEAQLPASSRRVESLIRADTGALAVRWLHVQ